MIDLPAGCETCSLLPLALQAHCCCSCCTAAASCTSNKDDPIQVQSCCDVLGVLRSHCATSCRVSCKVSVRPAGFTAAHPELVARCETCAYVSSGMSIHMFEEGEWCSCPRWSGGRLLPAGCHLFQNGEPTAASAGDTAAHLEVVARCV